MRIGKVEKPYMTVGELRKLLEDFPQDMPVIQNRWSDYEYLEPPTVVQGVEVNRGEYVRKFHFSELSGTPTPGLHYAERIKGEEWPVAVREYCHFEGN